jgi:hypothetical protein
MDLGRPMRLGGGQLFVSLFVPPRLLSGRFGRSSTIVSYPMHVRMLLLLLQYMRTVWASTEESVRIKDYLYYSYLTSNCFPATREQEIPPLRQQREF